MEEISLDKTKFRSVYVALWELLNSGIAKQDWFWYGEVGLYGDGGAEEWRPLLLRRIRRPKGTVQMPNADFASPRPCRFFMPGFYEEFFKATSKPNVLSVLRTVHRQFDLQRRDEAPLPVFAALNYNERSATAELQDCLIHRTTLMKHLVQGRYRLLFSDENLNDMNTASKHGDNQYAKCVEQYATYIETIVNRDFRNKKTRKQEIDKQHIARMFYPEQAWLLALPIYTIQRDRPLLLAIFIIIAEGVDFSCDDRATFKSYHTRLQEIERQLIQIEVEATHILSHRYFNLIDGYVPGSDPIALLAHPSLSKNPFLEKMRMEDIVHNDDKEFEKRYKEPNSIYSRAFERSVVAPERILKKNTDTSNGLANHDIRCWLKALYAHKLERAHLPYPPGDSPDYKYNQVRLKQLVNLLALLGREDSSSTSPPNVGVWVYRSNGYNEDNCTFHWPVEPGIRFLIPWLKTVQGIAEEVNLAEKLHCTELRIVIIERSSAPLNTMIMESRRHMGNIYLQSTDTNANKNTKSVFEQWAALGALETGCPNGLVVSFKVDSGQNSGEIESSLKRQVQGWRRALIDPHGRRGKDTTLIQKMMLGNIGDVLKGAGLNFPEDDPLFLPLLGSLPIKVDFEAAGAELLMAVTW